ncbi:hypothetical protein BV22DRAFT_1135867 [Leucogyrophana mollusca]|uniref:Uncharacterized protein n=1 Tax=Leucogyrophana mollusca TaxID=85980 RepID=A0ACB8AVE6_9AGAM|nr:hypothetical protein BV22DRAFT_1135867 [Leucogyrophana mollusca]
MQLAFSMPSFVLCHPPRKASPFAHSTLNPCIGILPTLIATFAILERSIPCNELAQFFYVAPRTDFSSQGLSQAGQKSDGGGRRSVTIARWKNGDGLVTDGPTTLWTLTLKTTKRLANPLKTTKATQKKSRL